MHFSFQETGCIYMKYTCKAMKDLNFDTLSCKMKMWTYDVRGVPLEAQRHTAYVIDQKFLMGSMIKSKIVYVLKINYL